MTPADYQQLLAVAFVFAACRTRVASSAAGSNVCGDSRVDEIGYLPVIPGGGNLFFQLVNARYEKGAMILTSHRGFHEQVSAVGASSITMAGLPSIARC